MFSAQSSESLTNYIGRPRDTAWNKSGWGAPWQGGDQATKRNRTYTQSREIRTGVQNQMESHHIFLLPIIKREERQENHAPAAVQS